MKVYGGVDVYIHIFLTSALVWGELPTSRHGRFAPGERAPGTRWIWGWVGPRAGLDDMEKRKILTLPGLELRPLCHPACKQSQYQLRYPGSRVIMVGMFYHYVKYRIMYVSEKKRKCYVHLLQILQRDI
jgi:hypothetical protein